MNGALSGAPDPTRGEKTMPHYTPSPLSKGTSSNLTRISLMSWLLFSPLSAASAQRAASASDVVAAALSMFSARATARQVAAELRGTHRQSLDQATSVLKEVGYAAGDIASAIRTEYSATAIPAHEAMTRAGFSSAAITSALHQAGIPVPMDCIDRQGYPVPCAQFGGMTHAPVTSQVAWSPQAKGYVDSSLTITGVNIPPVDVVLGSFLLATTSATTAKVVVRLPAIPTTGALELRRKSDGVKGQLVSAYEVVPAPLTWTGWGTVAAEAAVADIHRWLSGARIAGSHCQVTGPLATTSVGAFGTNTDFLGKVRTELLDAGAPSAVATAWDATLRSAWWDWANKLVVPGLPWYPTFGVVAASSAPATPNVPTPLAALPSAGVASMSTALLNYSVTAALGSRASEPGAAAEIASFAAVVGARFLMYQAKGIVAGVTGSGPVPSYNGSPQSAGPVQNGTCSGTAILGPTAVLF